MAKSLEYTYKECRAMGHSWRHRGKIGSDTKGKYVAPFGWSAVGFLSYCPTCRGWRVKWMTRSGEVVNRYYPPDGYSRAGEEYKPTAREWRQHYVADAFEEFTQTERNTA